MKAEADRLRLRTKQRFAADGTRTGGLPFRRGHLHCLLTNPLYAGRIRHQRRVYEGQHPSIIAPELWDAVQAQLQAGAAKPRRRTTKGRAARSPLAGKLFDETGDRLTPSHTKKKNGQRLRYYVSRRLIQHSGQKDLSGWRLPAPMLEQTVVHLIRQHVDATTFSASLIHTPTMQELASVRRFLDGLCSGSKNDSASAAPLLRLIRRVDISPGSVSILLDRNTFAACLSMGPERIREDALRILAPFRLRRRGVEIKLVLGNPTKSVDRTLLRNIANALSWLDRIKAGKTYEQIAIENAIPTDRVRKAIRYAFLAPDIVRAIVEGRQPVGLTSSYLLHHPLSDDWEEQRARIATLLCWFSVKMTARLDVNATPGVRMSPLAPGIVPECSGASRVKRATRAGFAALDTPSALWYSLLVGERERSGAPGIRVFMRAPCYYAAHAAPLVPAPVSGPAPTRSLGPCQP